MSNNSLTESEVTEIEDLKLDLIIEAESAPTSPLGTCERSGAEFVASATRSAPASPTGRQVGLPIAEKVKFLISGYESKAIPIKTPVSRVAQTVKMATISSIKNDCTNIKRVCTRFLNQLKKAESEDSLDSTFLAMQKPKIISRINEMENKEMELNDLVNKSGVAADHADSQYCVDLVKYMSDCEAELYRICRTFDAAQAAAAADAAAAVPTVNPVQLLDSVSQIGNNPIKISVDCPCFYGDESDRLEYKNWLVQFQSVVNTRRNWSEEFKITYLKTKVLKNAALFIAHLDARPGNYDLCLEALKEQYLDEEFIKDEYFKLLYTEKPEYDETYTKSRVYIASVRNHLHNLKTHYDIDLLEENSSGHKFLSHIIFGKFSKELRQAFTWECKTDYPSFSQILASYGKVINSLIRNKKGPASKPVPKANNSKPWQNKNPNNAPT